MITFIFSIFFRSHHSEIQNNVSIYLKKPERCIMEPNNIEQMDELREVLERIEEKLISAGKIYSAIQFQIWLVAMVLYYLIIGPLSTVPWQLTAAYWILAFIVFAYFSSKIWRRLVNLFRSYGKATGSSPSFGLGITLSWIAGSVIGWVLIPSLVSAPLNPLQSVAIGFLTFISISVFGMFLTFLYFAKSLESEMIPAFLIPAAAIPVVWLGSVQASMVYAGFIVTFAFSLTVIAYLLSAFKALR